ncbi:MAG: hypothetical protein ACRC2J_08775, partial [Microcoleaceae cyanobacterium]
TSKDKFSTRLAIYALRCLKQISQSTGRAIALIQPAEIALWISQDEQIQKQIELDESFADFFTRLVVSALRPLEEIAKEYQSNIEDLTVIQVINWFEKMGKIQSNSPDISN